MDLTHQIVRRLLRDDEVQFSRNRNFEAYEDPQVQRAMRIYRHLQSLEDDLLGLESDGRVSLEAVERDEEEVAVRLIFEEAKGRRISYLKAKEWELLLESAKVSRILEGVLDDVDGETRELLEGELGVS